VAQGAAAPLPERVVVGPVAQADVRGRVALARGLGGLPAVVVQEDAAPEAVQAALAPDARALRADEAAPEDAEARTAAGPHRAC
jgi:hypothetical protein